MFNQDEKKSCLLQKLCDKKDTKEISTEYTLPDYLPDITKLLRVSARVETPSKYINSDSADYDGTIIYNIIYATSDGEIKNAEIKDDFSGNIALKTDIDPTVTDIKTRRERKLPSFQPAKAHCKIETCNRSLRFCGKLHRAGYRRQDDSGKRKISSIQKR